MCMKAHNKREEQRIKERTVTAWQTANYAAAAFGGKLKPLKYYLNDKSEQKQAPKISKEDFLRKLKELEQGG